MAIFKTLILCSLALLYGCDGIQSSIPAISKYKSDKAEGIIGYWNLESFFIIKDGKLEALALKDMGSGSYIYYIQDNSSGLFFNKDYLYSLKSTSIEDGKTEEVGNLNLRVKNINKNTHLMQVCSTQKNEKNFCYYTYLAIEKDQAHLYPLYERNLDNKTKNILGFLYINAKDRNNITLPDDFVNEHGDDFIDSLINNKITYPVPRDESGLFAANLKKVSFEEATSVIDNAKKQGRRAQ